MAIITYVPTTRDMVPSQMSWGLQDTRTTSTSSLNGSVQEVEMPGTRYVTTLTWPDTVGSVRNEVEAIILSGLRNGNRLELYDMRPGCSRPRGTIATAGIYTLGTTAQFARTIVLAGSVSGATLRAGDKFGLTLDNGLKQLFTVEATTTANGSGVLTVPVHTEARGAIGSGRAAVLIRPTALFGLHPSAKLPSSASAGGALGGLRQAISVDLLELFR